MFCASRKKLSLRWELWSVPGYLASRMASRMAEMGVNSASFRLYSEFSISARSNFSRGKQWLLKYVEALSACQSGWKIGEKSADDLMYPFFYSCCSGFPIATLVTTFHHSSAILAKKWISDGMRSVQVGLEETVKSRGLSNLSSSTWENRVYSQWNSHLIGIMIINIH